MAVPLLVYGNESWVMKKDLSHIQAAEIKVLSMVTQDWIINE